jgi:ligand-binding SRPBCC domain-containing protein
MLKFVRAVEIAASIEQVWAFHDRPDILTLLTPPWQPVQVVRREGGLGLGAESEFRLWLGPWPVTWLARHVDCEPPFLFADEQVAGPMDYWLHRHRFEPLADGQMRLTDEIDYALPAGGATEPWLERWVSARLNDMFAYRHRVTKLACEPLSPAQHRGGMLDDWGGDAALPPPPSPG